MERPSRIVVLRHSLQGPAGSDAEPQLTPLGVTVSMLMGAFIQERLKASFGTAVSGPRARGVESAKAFLQGASGIQHRYDRLIVEADPGLLDLASDKRPIIQACREAYRAFASANNCSLGEAVFRCSDAREGLDLKVKEALAVIRPKLGAPGDHLVAGVHEVTVDALLLAVEGLPLTHEQVQLHGGFIGRAEGFVIHNTLTSRQVETIRIPPYIQALINTYGEQA